MRHVRGEHRPERRAAPSAANKRISFGCINLPPTFHDRTVAQLFDRREGVVYVPPEQHTIGDFFPFERSGDSSGE